MYEGHRESSISCFRFSFYLLISIWWQKCVYLLFLIDAFLQDAFHLHVQNNAPQKCSCCLIIFCIEVKVSNYFFSNLSDYVTTVLCPSERFLAVCKDCGHRRKLKHCCSSQCQNKGCYNRSLVSLKCWRLSFTRRRLGHNTKHYR